MAAMGGTETRRPSGRTAFRPAGVLSARRINQSARQLSKRTGRKAGDPHTGAFDYVYCAGLFDYLSDRICRRLLEIFYDMLAPGGLLVATNVHVRNPSRHWMECVMDWHLVYRDDEQFIALAPEKAPKESIVLKADPTGVNIFLEVRKPLNG